MLVGLSMMGFASAGVVKCKFSSLSWKDYNRSLWTCNVNNKTITNRDLTIAPINTFFSVQGLSIMKNLKIEFIPVNLAQKFPGLIAAKIFCCSIESVEDHHFQGLPKLIWLNLRQNKIKSISSNAFKDNINLEFLSYNNNKIKYINDNIFTQLQHFKEVYFHNNQIRLIDPLAFTNLWNIEKINLDKNNLTLLNTKSIALQR